MEGQDQGHVAVREQDRFMPIANVIRIMRRVLPTHAKISDDAKETIQECVSEYISFVTGEANERCQREQRKTVTAEDILWAMSKLGFDDYIEPLSVFLSKYREFEGDQRGSIRGEPLVQALKYKSYASGATVVTHGANPHVTHGVNPMQVQMQMHHHHQYGFLGESNGNVGPPAGSYYYAGSYGDGESSGGAGSTEALPLMNNFDNNNNHDHHDHNHYGLK